MFAIVNYNGNQYRLSPDKEYKIDLDLTKKEKEKMTFSDVLLYSDDKKVLVGTPNLVDISVEAEVLGQIKDKKVTGLKFHSKKRYKRNLGHRQMYTQIKVLKINLKNEK